MAAINGGHLGYRNRMILAILNLYNTSMPPIKFKLNPTYRSGAECDFKIFKMAAMVAILDIRMEPF